MIESMDKREGIILKESKYYAAYMRQKLVYDVLYKWMLCDIYNRDIVNEFMKNGISRIAIYGAGDLGSILYNKLKKSEVTVDCFIDKYSKYQYYGVEDIRIVKINELAERAKIDLIVNTVIWADTDVRNDLRQNNVQIPVISLEDIIMEM